MQQLQRLWLVLGALWIGSGIALEAWHAHGLRDSLEAAEYESFGRAIHQQYLAGIGLLLVGALGGALRRPLGGVAAVALVIGCVLFSGSIYLRALTGAEELTRAAPSGGSLQILAWGVVALAAGLGPRPAAKT